MSWCLSFSRSWAEKRRAITMDKRSPDKSKLTHRAYLDGIKKGVFTWSPTDENFFYNYAYLYSKGSTDYFMHLVTRKELQISYFAPNEEKTRGILESVHEKEKEKADSKK
jgi:hypothetical protein